MPVLPSTGPTAAARLVIRATESSHASASASQANYVDHMHHDIHGSQVWHWDGQSSINLIFIVAFLGALILVFMGLVLLSRLLARTNAPSGDDALPFRRPTSVPIMVQPHMAQVPRVDRSPFDEVRKPFADDPKGSFPSLPSTPRYHSNVSTPNESAASSSQNVIAPLLSSFPLGNKRGNKRASPRGDGPPPALKDPKRQSRYGSALSRSTSESSLSAVSCSSDSPPPPEQHIKRVESIGRGNSLRYSRSNDRPEPDLGRSNSARLAQRARSGRSVRGPRRMPAEVNVQPYRDLSTQPTLSADSQHSDPCSPSYYKPNAPSTETTPEDHLTGARRAYAY